MRANTVTKSILIVDDDKQVLDSFVLVLKSAGFSQVRVCSDPRDVSASLEEEATDIMILDLTMPHKSGEEVMKETAELHPDVSIVVATSTNDIGKAVECMKAGAVDYLVKPIEAERLIATIENILRFKDLETENNMLRERLLNEELKHPEYFSAIITNNKKMLALFRYIESVAGSPQSVLIVGETGTGKELVAHSIHKASRRQGNFIAVNVAGLDDSVFADTLFGHKKGAFTSADASRSGLLKEAEHGTLFLDEIGDLSLNLQVKLLRLLQTNEYFQIGSDVPLISGARIVVATNRNLEEATRNGEFRLDLYYRLHTYRIHLPTLRERSDDLQLLLEYFLNKSAEQTGKKKPSYPKQLLTLLSCYEFPGNIRELESIVHDAVSMNESRIIPLEYFKRRIPRFCDEAQALTVKQNPVALSLAGDYLPTIEEAEYFLVKEAMKKTGDNQVLAAQLLGITRQTLKSKLDSAKGC